MNIVQDKNMLPDDQWIRAFVHSMVNPKLTGCGSLNRRLQAWLQSSSVRHEKRVYVLSNKDQRLAM